MTEREPIIRFVGDMVDITEPKYVEVKINHDRQTLWVNVDHVCRLRCNYTGVIEVIDLSVMGEQANDL